MPPDGRLGSEPRRTRHRPLRGSERARRPSRPATKHRAALGEHRPHTRAVASAAHLARPPERCHLGSERLRRTQAHDIAPAEGKLGVLLVGLGAVASTFIAGVEHARRGTAEPIGSLTQMRHHPPRQAHRKPHAADQGLRARWRASTTSSSAPGTRSPTTPTRPRSRCGVLDRHEHIEPIADFLKSIEPMPAAFDQRYVKPPPWRQRQAGRLEDGNWSSRFASRHPRLQGQQTAATASS